jgi:hypothetical protein
LIALAFAGLFFLIPAGIIAVGSYAAGQNPDGELTRLVFRTAPPALWALTSVFLGLRVLTQTSDPDNLDGYLTTIPHRELFVGIGLVEAGGTLAYLGVPILLAAGGFAVGSGSPLVAVTILLAGLTAIAAGVATGFAVGFTVKNVAVRSALVARFRVLIWSVIFIAYMWTFISGEADTLFEPALRLVARPPLSWLGAFALLPLGAGASVVEGIVGFVVTVAATAVLAAVSAWLAGLLWYADGVSVSGEAVGDGETSVETGLLGRIVGRRTAWVARTATTRARRAPLKLVFVAYPAFLLAPMVTEALETGTVPSTLPPTAALYCAWAGGAAFALNPLGDQGATLPVTATSGVPGKAFLRGLLLPGAALGGGSGMVLGGVLAALAGAVPFRIVLVALSGAVLGTGAPALASGFGVVFPKYDASKITRSREAVVPSIFAFGTYSLVLVILAAPGLVLQYPLLAGLIADLTDISELVVSTTGVLLTMVLVGVGGYVSYRLAARRFDGFTVS